MEQVLVSHPIHHRRPKHMMFCRLLTRGIADLPRRLTASAILLLSSRQELAGLNVSTARGASSAISLLKLREALSLIESRLPLVHSRMMGDIRRIILVHSGGPEYWPFVNGIALTQGIVERSDVDLLAMTLVHEATHAHLMARGIPYSEENRERIERICVKAEVRLARLLPNSSDLEAFALEKLQRQWWTPGAIDARRKRAARSNVASHLK